jgi:hypothetical protein
MPIDQFKVLLCGGLVFVIAAMIIRDLVTGVSGISGTTNIRCVADVNAAGYWLMILFKTGAAIYFTMVLLHLLGMAGDPNLTIKGMLSGLHRDS